MSATYKVYSGDDCLLTLKNYCTGMIFILADENTLKYCLPLFLEKSGISFKETIPVEIESGEQNKNLETCRYIWKALTIGGADRQAVLVNLGGGVITDTGGFAAACFKRGIKFVNVPTTLLAQIDAAIGGKTGVNLDHVKNQIGLFKNPEAIFIDTDFLKTLPQEHIISAFAEALKYGLISDKALWERVSKVNINEANNLYALINTCIKIKMDVVAKDPEEKNIRKMLNFGHTIGHAIETLMHRKNISVTHGEAVATGLVVESMISSKVLGLDQEILQEIVNVINYDFSLLQFSENEIPALIDIMLHDKKNVNNKINFTLIEEIGTARIDQFCEAELIEASLLEYPDLLLKNL